MEKNYNPCGPETPEDERIPAKIWELLRRNPDFIEVVGKVRELERKSQVEQQAPGDDRNAARRAWDEAFTIVESFAGTNDFAADAIRWLVPCPIFRLEEIALPRKSSSAEDSAVPVTLRIGVGTTPNPKDKKHWKYRRTSRSGAGDAPECPHRWGPVINLITTKDDRLKGDTIDAIAKWRESFVPGRFTLESTWPDSPIGFRRRFRQNWVKQLGGIGGGEETGFFKGWNLGDLWLQPEMTETETEDYIARSSMFEDLAKLRVFAVPHLLHKQHAKDVFKGLLKTVADQLPEEAQLLGTHQDWSDFLQVSAIEMREKVEVGEAIRRFIYRSKSKELETKIRKNARQELNLRVVERWYRKGRLAARPIRKRELSEWKEVHALVSRAQRSLSAAYRTNVKRRVEFIRPLIAATFPILDVTRLMHRPPNKR